MDQKDHLATNILNDLGACPATPFFESGPAEYVKKTLDRLSIPYFCDSFGNIIGHHQNNPANTPAIAFVAHMDHPGFEAIETSKHGLIAKASGGVPAAAIVKSIPVLILSSDGKRVPAFTTPHPESAEPDDRRGQRLVYVHPIAKIDLPIPSPVVFDLPDFVLEGDVIRMRAVDDLAGCAAILASLDRLVKSKAAANVYGVFTRAEEIGLYGAKLLAEFNTLPTETVIISIESSAVIPGVFQGGGPVIRTGDAAYTFSATAEQILSSARDSLQKSFGDFKSQRQLMSGGVCEATAFAALGYNVTGLAFPLGNYHNATTHFADLNGDVDAEHIHLSDYLGGVKLITEAVSIKPTQPSWLSYKTPKDIRSRLKNSSS